MTISKIRKEIFIAIAAFILPIILMLLISVFGEFYPFGETSILVADMKIQFVDYIGYMKKIFFGNDDFFYTFSKTFGGDMTGFAAYYLFNPFYLLLLLFPNTQLSEGILFIIILMSGFSGLTFHFLLKEVNELRFASLIFSTAYAMMGFYVAYVNCIHYFFSISMLPLVIMGLYRTYRNEKVSIIYILSVFACVCSNYYIGYMVLIFTAVFFVLMLAIDMESISDIKSKINVIFIVLYSTILGIMISAFSLLSVVFSLRGQKSSALSLSLHRNFHLYELFSGLYINAFHGNVSDGLPIIYSGIIPVIFLFFFFMNRNIKIKTKICAALLFLFIIAGFWIDALNVAWHGFAHPIGFPYRNSFLFSFLVIFFGYKGFLAYNNEFKLKHLNWIIVIFSIYSLILILTHNIYVNITQIAVTGVFLVLSLIIIVMLKSGRKYIIPAIAGIIILESIELIYNGLSSVNAYYGNKAGEGNTHAYFAEYVNEQEEIVNRITENDNSFFRMDKLYRRDHNDAMLIGYNGLSHFSSCENDNAKRFMGKMGFRDNGLWAFYSQGSTAFSESLMGMKYLVSQYDETSKPYENYFEYNGRYVFKNPYALSLGFTAGEDIAAVDIQNRNLFEIQNEIASAMTGEQFTIYEESNVSNIELHNVEVENDCIYKIINKDEEAYIEYTVTAKNNDFIFMYFDAPEMQKTTLYIDGAEKAPLFGLYDWCIRECGYFNPGESVTLKLKLDQDEIEIDNVYFYSENKKALEKWYETESKNKIEVTKDTSSHLLVNADIVDEADKIVFSIPYDKDWHIKIDGNEVESENVLDALLAVEIEKGKHFIEMRYIPRGFVYGLIISIIGIITTFCVIFIKKR